MWDCMRESPHSSTYQHIYCEPNEQRRGATCQHHVPRSVGKANIQELATDTSFCRPRLEWEADHEETRHQQVSEQCSL